MVDDGDGGHFGRARQQVVHEGATEQLALFRKSELLQQRRADAVRDAAVGHAVNDVGADHRAAVVATDVAVQRHLARRRVDAGEHDMRLEGMAGVHLDAAVFGRQIAPGGHFPDKFFLQSRLHACGQAVVVAVRDLDQGGPVESALRVGGDEDVAAVERQFTLGGMQVVRGQLQQLDLELLRRPRRGTAEHDRHAAADRAVRRQGMQRIGVQHADAVGFALQDFADHGGHQRLVRLARGRRAHQCRDRAANVDAHQARVHPRRRFVLRVEERLETRIAARRLQTGRDADARQQALCAQGISLRFDRCQWRGGERLAEHGRVIARVVMRAAGYEIRKFVRRDQVALAQRDAVHLQEARHLVDAGLDGVIGGRLAEAAHRLLRRLVRHHRDGFVGDAGDAIGPDDGADRLAQLQR